MMEQFIRDHPELWNGMLTFDDRFHSATRSIPLSNRRISGASEILVLEFGMIQN